MTAVGAIVLFGLQILVAGAVLPMGAPIPLGPSEFRWFNSAPPGPVTAGPTSWVLPVPNETRADGQLAVDDAVSLASFHLGELAFTATFVNGTPNSGTPSQFADEMVVFAASDVVTYKGFEFGIRLSLADGYVYAYWQYPTAPGVVQFQGHRLFVNDGRPHSYTLTLTGNVVSVTVDGAYAVSAQYPILPPSAFYVVTTAHRSSSGWSSAGRELVVANVTVRPGLV